LDEPGQVPGHADDDGQREHRPNNAPPVHREFMPPVKR
jgi:hypothetical protein